MKTKLTLGVILFLAIILRFYGLGRVPSGFVNDEASFGYNAYSLLKTGRDEFGEPWPIIFRSFGEGKLPAYVYLTMPAVAVFGLNEFAVRLPSASLGVLTVWLVYLLVKKYGRDESWALLSALVLAFMPWHIHFSRAAFEANVALFFIVLASWLWQLKRFKLAILAFILSIFTYNAARLFVPLWLAYLGWRERRYLPLIIVLAVGSILFFIKPELNRFSGISIFNAQSGIAQRLEQKYAESSGRSLWIVRLLHNKPVEFAWDFSRRYLSHFDPGFLFFAGDPNRPRYRVPDTGQLLWVLFPFVISGGYLMLKLGHWPLLVWLLLAPLSGAITFETPSAIRSLFMVIPLAAIAALGLSRAKIFWLPIVVVIGFNLAAYLDAYFVHMPVHQPYEWQGGYKELVRRVNELMPDYDQALITDSRGTAYIYFLFYSQYDPVKWQARSREAVTSADKFGFTSIDNLDNLYFVGEKCPAKIPQPGTLYVCTQENHPQLGFTVLKEPVNFDDGQPAFVLFESTGKSN